MKIVITTPARNRLKELYEYHRQQGTTRTAQKIKSDIDKKVQVLKEFP